MAYDELRVAAPEYTSPDVLQAKAPEASKGFGNAAIDLKNNPQLRKLFEAANPIVVPNQPEVKAEVTPTIPESAGQKMTIEVARTLNNDVVASVGDQLQHEGQTGMGVKSSILGDCLDAGCQALSKKVEPTGNVIEAHQQQLAASVALQPKPPELDVQKTYTPDLTMKSPSMMA